ncbi:MAG: hypothetical protein R3F43_18000 [bacterium]
MAAAAVRQGDHLVAIQTLDRAARLLRGRGRGRRRRRADDAARDLWPGLPDGTATAHLRYRQALLLVPRHAPALLGLAELARQEGDAAGARARFEEILRQPADVVDRAEVHLRLGLPLAGEPGEAGLAAAHLQKALEGSPAQVELALGTLEGLHRAAGRFDDVARVLALAAQRAVEPAVRSELARAAGPGARPAPPRSRRRRPAAAGGGPARSRKPNDLGGSRRAAPAGGGPRGPGGGAGGPGGAGR